MPEAELTYFWKCVKCPRVPGGSTCMGAVCGRRNSHEYLPRRPSHKVDGSGRPYTKTASRGRGARRVLVTRGRATPNPLSFPLNLNAGAAKSIMPSVKERSAKLVADVTSATVTSPSSTTTPRLHPHVAPLATGTELGRRVVRRAPDRSGSIRHVSRRTMPRFLVLAAWAHAPVPMKPLLRVLAALTKA
jgi:hypothetical protein